MNVTKAVGNLNEINSKIEFRILINVYIWCIKWMYTTEIPKELVILIRYTWNLKSSIFNMIWTKINKYIFSFLEIFIIYPTRMIYNLYF